MPGGVEGENSRMTSPLRPEDPTRVGDYDLVARIGKGGQGVVYLGKAPDGTRVAVKVMETSWASNSRARSRFAKEIEAASKVAPFCTAALLDSDINADPPYIVSEYIEGPSLRDAVLRDGPRTGAALDRLAISTATALVAIHQAGVIHRDFKPANVLLGPDGPRVIDFGIARHSEATVTATDSIVGTPAYMAPEQVEGRELTPAVDIFAWAGVMVFAATGQSPFHDETLPAIINRVLHQPPRLDGVDERLRPLLEACLAKEPERRPTAVQVLGVLVGHDPATLPQVPVEEVLENGYTAALNEQTQIAATAALPIPIGDEAPEPAPTAVMPAAEDTPAPESRTPVSGLAALAANRPADEAPASSPPSGPLRTTSGLAALVNRGENKQPTASSPGEGPPRRSAGPGHQPLPPRSTRERKTVLSWLVAAGILIIVLAGGWFLIDTFLLSPNGQSPEATPVDGTRRDTPAQDGIDDSVPSPSAIDPDTPTSSDTGYPGGELYPSLPYDDMSQTDPMEEPHLNPTIPGEGPWHSPPAGEEAPGQPHGGGAEEGGSEGGEQPGTGGPGGSGEGGAGVGRVAVSPAAP